MWGHIMKDDEEYDYSSPQLNESTPPVEAEVDIYTSSAGIVETVADVATDDVEGSDADTE